MPAFLSGEFSLHRQSAINLIMVPNFVPARDSPWLLRLLCSSYPLGCHRSTFCGPFSGVYLSIFDKGFSRNLELSMRAWTFPVAALFLVDAAGAAPVILVGDDCSHSFVSTRRCPPVFAFLPEPNSKSARPRPRPVFDALFRSLSAVLASFFSRFQFFWILSCAQLRFVVEKFFFWKVLLAIHRLRLRRLPRRFQSHPLPDLVSTLSLTAPTEGRSTVFSSGTFSYGAVPAFS